MGNLQECCRLSGMAGLGNRWQSVAGRCSSTAEQAALSVVYWDPKVSYSLAGPALGRRLSEQEPTGQ